MSQAEPSIPATLDNPEAWEGVVQQLKAKTGLTPAMTPQALAEMIGDALPLLFASADEGSALQGLFAPQVISERVRNQPDYADFQPQAAAVHLVGVPDEPDGNPAIRVHLDIRGLTVGGQPKLSHQFWDLEINPAPATPKAKPQTSCPNCGAPLPAGQLFCAYCGSDVRQGGVGSTGILTVVKIQLY